MILLKLYDFIELKLIKLVIYLTYYFVQCEIVKRNILLLNNYTHVNKYMEFRYII